MTSQRGSLTIAGSGVASIGHLTLQTIAAIENADIVCYSLSDPVTEAFIRKKNPNTYDLYQLYDDEKPRMETYIQMSEVLLSKVREGQDVVGLFYGHPGLVTSVPGTRALKIARKEGYSAKMLPGVSVEDCIFADMGLDPFAAGLSGYRATDIIENNRPLSPNLAALVRQVGITGNPSFNFDKVENTQLEKLVDLLEGVYGGDKEIIHYIPAHLPMDEALQEKIKVSDLRKDEVRRKIGPSSSFFLLSNDPAPDFFETPEGKKLERQALSSLANHQPGKNYPQPKEILALTEALERLATDPRALEGYKHNRQSWVNDNGRALTEEERDALLADDSGRKIYALLTGRELEHTRVPPL